MNESELRAFALDEKERRRRVERDYELPAGAFGPKVIVRAAVLADNPYTAELHRVAKTSSDENLMLLWIAPGRSTVELSAAQVRSLAEQIQHHDVWLQGFFEQLLIWIETGAISTPEKIESADWPA